MRMLPARGSRPMGAFMALPIAAWITSFVKHYGASYPLAYRSPYDDEEPPDRPQGAPEVTRDRQ